MAVSCDKIIREFGEMKFPEQLRWLMNNGIRPRIKLENIALGKKGNWWDDKELAAELTVTFEGYYKKRRTVTEDGMRRNISNWKRNESACRREFWGPIQDVFCGDNQSLGPIREQLRIGMQRGWEERWENIYGRQISTESTLRDVYFGFDVEGYMEEGRSDVEDIPYELFMEWWKAYPPGFLYSSIGPKKQIAAITGFFPVPKKWALDFIERRTSEHKLLGKDISAAASGRPRTYWYFSGLSTDSSVTQKSLHSHLPNILFWSIISWVRENRSCIGSSRFVIVSEGSTYLGEELLSNQKYFGFPLSTLALNEHDRPRFKREMDLRQLKELLLRARLFRDCEGARDVIEVEFRGI